MIYRWVVPVVCILVAATTAAPSSAASNPAPRIEHAQVTMGVRGQGIFFRAQVTDESQAIGNVTLFYAVSRDAAPYKVPMRDSGNGLFTGSIPADVTAGLDRILYYIEARNAAGAAAETPWYTIAIKGAQAGQTPPPETALAPVVPVPAPATPSAPPRSSWKKPALIAGGVLVAGGAALALSGGGGGGGGSDNSGGSSNTVAGTYSGRATIGLQFSGSNATYEAHAFTLTIDSSGRVASDTLYSGAHLASTLSGANFLLVSAVQQAGLSGEIRFLGTVVNSQIAGTVQGSVGSNTVTGTYSGNFSATK
jgi:hypothetical protein